MNKPGTLTIRLNRPEKNPFGTGRKGRRALAAAVRKATKKTRVRVVVAPGNT